MSSGSYQFDLFKDQLDSIGWNMVRKELYFMASKFNPDEPECEVYIVHGSLENYDTIDFKAELKYPLYNDDPYMKIERWDYQDVLLANAYIYIPYGICNSGQYIFYSNLGSLKVESSKGFNQSISGDTLKEILISQQGHSGECYIGPGKCGYLLCGYDLFLMNAQGVINDTIRISNAGIKSVNWIDGASLPDGIIE